MELFHGPTFAFKDVALQFLGNLFEYFLRRKNEGKVGLERETLTVVGATSGDTGGCVGYLSPLPSSLGNLTIFVRTRAAIYGLRSKQDISIFILHPKNRISPIQEAQMTSVTDENVFNVALEGTFDDCQVSLAVSFFLPLPVDIEIYPAPPIGYRQGTFLRPHF